MSIKKIKWGFIGCGRVVENKSGQAFKTIRDSQIYSIMRSDIHKARISAEKFGSPCYYDNVSDLLCNDEVNATYICTPPGLHFEQAMQCCAHGKAAYIEKPFARNYEEASAIVSAFAANKVPLFVAHYKRALPRFVEIKRILESGEIGYPTEIDFRMNRFYNPQGNVPSWLYNPVLSGGGKFFDIAPHTIDLMVFLFGNFVQVSGNATNNNSDYLVEDIVTMSFKTEKGIVGTANFNLIADTKNDKMIVYGTKGHLEFSVHASDVVKICSPNGTKELKIKTPKFVSEPLITTIVDELLGRGVCPSTGVDALPTAKIIDTVLDSYYGGRQRDFWNHPELWNRIENSVLIGN